MVFTKPIVSPQEARSGQVRNEYSCLPPSVYPQLTTSTYKHTTGMGDRLLLSVPLEMQEEERWHMSITSRNANPPTAAQIPKKEDKDTENLFDYLLHLNRCVFGSIPLSRAATNDSKRWKTGTKLTPEAWRRIW